MNQTIPAGTLLCHGTGEPFPLEQAADLRTGGDGMFWCTDAEDSAIAQTYIPVSGCTAFLQLKHALEPQCNAECAATWLQHQCGLEFANVQWHGSRPQSYRIVKEPFPYEFTSDPGTNVARREESRKKTIAKMEEILTGLGYKPEWPDPSPEYASWRLKWHGGKIQPANWRMPGRLILLKTTQNIQILDITQGREGCLTNPDYKRLSLFASLESEGFHGIRIHDFAQVGEDHDNFGHTAIGLTKTVLKDAIQIVSIIPAQHPQDFFQNHHKTNNYQSVEYTTWKQTQSTCIR